MSSGHRAFVYPERRYESGQGPRLVGALSRRWQARQLRRGFDYAAIEKERSALESLADGELLARVEYLRRQQTALDSAPLLALVFEAERRLRAVPVAESVAQAVWMLLFGSGVVLPDSAQRQQACRLAACVLAIVERQVQVVHLHEESAQRGFKQAVDLYTLLGLEAVVLSRGHTVEQRRTAYQQGIVHVGISDLVLDYLRDRRIRPSGGEIGLRVRRSLNPAQGREQLMLPGLRFALVADGREVLYDSAMVSVVANDRRELDDTDMLAYAISGLAGQLEPDSDYRVVDTRVELTEQGRRRLAVLSATLAPALRREGGIEQMVCRALIAFICLRAGEDYAIEEGQVVLGDEVELSGTTPDLREFIALKEGYRPSQSSRPAGRLTCQRFLRRYLKLAALLDSAEGIAGEIGAEYRLTVVEGEPTGRDILLPDRMVVVAEQRDAWVIDWCREQRSAGREVLIDCGDDHQAQQLEAGLRGAGFTLSVLNREALVSSQALAQAAAYPLVILGNIGDQREHVVSLLTRAEQVMMALHRPPMSQEGRALWFACLEDPPLVDGLNGAEKRWLMRLWPHRRRAPVRWGVIRVLGRAERRMAMEKRQIRQSLLGAETHYRRMLSFMGVAE